MDFHGIVCKGKFVLQYGNVLPTVGTQGRLFYLTVDSYIYIDSGTAWLKLCKFSDLSDHLTDTVAAHVASAISYSNSTSGLTATDVQAAIDELTVNIDDVADQLAALSLTAANISYSNSTSGLTATDVQAAIDEVVTDLTAVAASNKGAIRTTIMGVLTIGTKKVIILTGYAGTLTEVVAKVITAPSGGACTITILKNGTGTALCTLTIADGTTSASTTTLDSSAKSFIKTDYYQVNITAVNGAEDLMISMV